MNITNHENARNRGFTLIELVVVIAIISILAAVLIPVISGFIAKANEQSDIATARLLLTSTTIAFGTDKLGPGTYTAIPAYGEDEITAPAPYHELLGFHWPEVKYRNAEFIVIVDFIADSDEMIQVLRVSDDLTEIYDIRHARFTVID